MQTFHLNCFTLLLLLTRTALFVLSRDVTLLDCTCPRAFRPVCGTDVQTYDSVCFLECARRYDQGLMLAYEGTCCPSAELCVDYFDPVCDQFGNFYPNDCVFDFHKCAQRRTGGPLLRIDGRGEQACASSIAASEAAKREKIAASKNWNSNNNLNNKISREISTGVANQKRQNSPLLISPSQKQQIPQVAAPSSPCHFFCDETLAPVCDSQSRTHKNRCKFDLAACRLRSRGIVSAMQIVREGPCHAEESKNFGLFPHAVSLRRVPSSPQLPPNFFDLANLNNDGFKLEENNKQQEIPSFPLPSQQNSQQNQQQNSQQNQQQQQQFPQSSPMLLPFSSSSEIRRAQQPSSKNIWNNQENDDGNEGRMEGIGGGGRQQLLQQQKQQQRFIPGAMLPPFSNERPQLKQQKMEQQPQKSSASPQCDLCREELSFEQNVVPVCDNTKTTHQSVCAFAKWNCESRLLGAEERLLVHMGECNSMSPIFNANEEECPNKCSHHYRPVCDSNGVTHPNFCAYKLYKCLQRNGKGRPVGWLVSLRECSPSSAAFSSTPLDNKNNKSDEQQIPKIAAITTTFTTPLFLHSEDSDEGEKEGEEEEGRRKQQQQKPAIECTDEPICEGNEIVSNNAGVVDEEQQQICDSDGRLHRNTCLFAHAHCVAARAGKTLRIVDMHYCKKVGQTETAQSSNNNSQKQALTKQPLKISLSTTTLPTLTSSKKQGVGSGEKKNEETTKSEEGKRLKLLDCERRWRDCDTTSSSDPYCGSDLKTYHNFCSIQKSQCLDDQLEILFKGQCEHCLASQCLAEKKTTTLEDDDSLFVCDQGGVTKSKCEFEALRCVYEMKFGHNITAAYEGKCCPSAESCPGEAEALPICDSTGGRHSNWCNFEVAKCRANKILKKPFEERNCSNNNKNSKNSSGGQKVVLNVPNERRRKSVAAFDPDAALPPTADAAATAQ